MERDNFPSPISEVLGKVFKKLSIEQKIGELKVLNSWREVVGEKIYKHSRPFSIKKGLVFVKVDNSGWLAELTYLKEKIISEFNKREGKKIIKDIYFRLGSIKNKKKIYFPSLKMIKLNKEEEEKIDSSLNKIENDSLRGVLKRILEKDTMLKRTRSTCQ